MIRCENITKSFDDKKVLRGITFEAGEGRIFGLLGPSGAGKTTLIKILTGQLQPDGGDAYILGKESAHLTGKDRAGIGIMMDDTGLYDRFSCEDNLRIYADIYKVDRSRIRESLDLVGLKDNYRVKASNLSKGMKTRLSLARVFMHSPKVIFLDEPTSGLDPATMKAIHRIIREKKKQGCTIFLTTHNMEEAADLCDEIALLNEGTIVEKGTPEEICLKYNHRKILFIRLADGEILSMPHAADSAEGIREIMKEGNVASIHSSEPNLETVFLELTGRKLEEEEA